MGKITGYAAIEYAESHGLMLNKYADPTEDAREGLTPDEAREIAREDPSLIYVEGARRKENQMDTKLTVRARFFSHYPIETRKVLVEDDGTIRVYDNVAGYYTICHALTRAAQRRIRKLARDAVRT